MLGCRINNYHSLCCSEASMFTIDVAVRDDDDDAVRLGGQLLLQNEMKYVCEAYADAVISSTFELRFKERIQ